MSRIPRPRSLRNLSADEAAQLNDEQHVLGCDCPACLPEAYHDDDRDMCPVAVDLGGVAA